MSEELESAVQTLQTEINSLPNLIVGPAVEEIYRNLKPLMDKLNALEEALSGVGASISTLPNDIVAPTLEEIFRNLLPMRDMLTATSQTLNTLKTEIKETSAEQNASELFAKLDDLQKTLLATGTTENGTFESKYTEIETKLSNISEQLSVNQSNLSVLPNQIVAPTLEEVFRNLTPISDTLKATQNSVSKLEPLLSALPNQIVAPTLDEVFRNLTPILDTLKATQSAVHNLEPILRKLEDRLAANAQIHTQENNNLKNSIQTVMNQVSVLQSNFDSKTYEHNEAFNVLDIAALSIGQKSTKKRRPKPKASYSPDKIFDDLQAFKPELFDTWKKLFDRASSSYIKAPNQNCSSWSSSVARAFKNYVQIYNKGQILDIGCGPHADPMYLQGLPSYYLSALEPLEIIGKPRFPIYRGMNEFIPFEDGAFQTVINATALDHVIDVERALEETARVLDKDGYFIIWYANARTAPNPVTDYDGPLDDYHLFHTNDEWFLPMLAKHFYTVDRRVYAAGPTSDNVFAVDEKL